jgi:hypothetical protein
MITAPAMRWTIDGLGVLRFSLHEGTTNREIAVLKKISSDGKAIVVDEGGERRPTFTGNNADIRVHRQSPPRYTRHSCGVRIRGTKWTERDGY